MPTLREINYARLLNRGFRSLAKRGIRPNFQKVVETLRSLLNRDKQGAILDPVPMKHRQSFPVQGFNKNLDQARFDFEGLYEGSLFLASQELERSVIVHENVQEIRRQLAKASESIERELLVLGSNFLDARVIRFADSQFIDLTETTAAVNLEDSIVTLATRGGVSRVIPPQLPSFPSELETLNDDAVVLPGSDFASIFTDTLKGWQVKTAGEFMRVRFDLGKRLRFGRVQIAIPDEGAVVELRTSHDSINYIKPTDPQVVANGRVNFTFETQEAQYVELYIQKPVAENQEGNVFTIHTLGMYTGGYESESHLVTTEIQPENGDLIKAVRIDVEAEVPAGTSVDVEVAAVDGAGSQLPWRLVKSKVVDFTQSNLGRVNFRATPILLYSSSPALGTPTARGLSAHGDYESALGMNDVWAVEDSVVFPGGVPANIDEHTLKLFRIDNWACDSRVLNESVQLVNKMLLGPSETQPLYIPIVDEFYDIAADTTTLHLKREVADNANMPVKGNEHAQVIRVSGTLDVAKNSAAEFSATATVVTDDEGNKTVTISGTLPSFAEHYDRIFVPGVGEVDIMEVDAANNLITVDPRPDYSPVLGGSFNARFQSRDLLPFLQNVNGRDLTFTQDLLQGERVIITYNSPMLRTQEDAIKSSIKVVSSIDSSRVAKLGVDYRIRDNVIELLNTTQLPNQPTANLYPIEVQFSYNRAVAGFTTYTAWCRVPEGANRVVEIAQPIRLFSDEKVTWMDPRGRVSDLEGLETITLESGWHRFSVVGTKAITEHGAIDQASALWQLLNLESAGGSYLFRSQNGYFDLVTGYRDPLVPVGAFYLQRQAYPGDSERFAYANGDLLSCMRLDNPLDAVRLEPGNTLAVSAADYRLEYRYSNVSGIRGLKIRLVMRRDPGADSSLTPVIRALKVRFT